MVHVYSQTHGVIDRTAIEVNFYMSQLRETFSSAIATPELVRYKCRVSDAVGLQSKKH